jgi:hypothetical protein
MSLIVVFILEVELELPQEKRDVDTNKTGTNNLKSLLLIIYYLHINYNTSYKIIKIELI